MINVVKYRDNFLAENINSQQFIGFYTREYFCLDNFQAFQIEFDGVLYQTVEHAYQALKFIDTNKDVYNKIVNATSAYNAMTIAHDYKEYQNPDWDNIKLEIMEKLLWTKVDQHPYVKQKLLSSKNYMLCEDSPYDYFWGIGENRTGENNLGKLWMKIREKIANES